MQSLFRGFWAAGKGTAVVARPSKYSPELRRRAVIEVIERNRLIVEVARDRVA
jgi:transposase-like protein